VDGGFLAVVCCVGVWCGVVCLVVREGAWWWVLSTVKGKWV
jgi:hypothetical protein